MSPEIMNLVLEKGGSLGILFLVILKLGEVIWNAWRAKEKVTEDSIKELKLALEKSSRENITLINDMHKLRVDVKRCFIALKHLSGDKWPEISNKFTELPIEEGK